MSQRTGAGIVLILILIPAAGSLVALVMMLWGLFGPKDTDGEPKGPRSDVWRGIFIIILFLAALALVFWLAVKFSVIG